MSRPLSRRDSCIRCCSGRSARDIHKVRTDNSQVRLRRKVLHAESNPSRHFLSDCRGSCEAGHIGSDHQILCVAMCHACWRRRWPTDLSALSLYAMVLGRTYWYGWMGKIAAAFSRGNTVFPATVTAVGDDVKPSCIQWRKVCEPFPPRPRGGASGSTIATMKVTPARFLSSARVGALMDASCVSLLYESSSISSSVHTSLRNTCSVHGQEI